MERYGSVYLVTNTVTQDQYVGQTRQKVKRRWNCHVNTANSKIAKKYKLGKAILTYGKSAFLFQEIYTAFDVAALNAFEIACIAELNPSYNITKGGAGRRGVSPSQVVRDRTSVRVKAMWANPEWREVHLEKNRIASQTPEATERGMALQRFNGGAVRWAGHIKKEKMPVDRSALTKASWQDPLVRIKRIEGLKRANTMSGASEKRSLAARGRKLPKAVVDAVARKKWKPLICPELGISFLCQNYASEYLSIPRSTISMALKRKGKVCGNYTLVRVA